MRSAGQAVEARRRRHGLAGAARGLVALLLSLCLLLDLLPAHAQLEARSLAATPVGTNVGTPTHPLPASSEALASRSIWSRPESYPLEPQSRMDLYRPSGEWIGRLILPAPQETTAAGAPAGDWVWIEIQQSPQTHRELIGRRLRLRWADDPPLQRMVKAVSTDIHLGEAARQAAEQFNVVPQRLDGRRGVGPLQSLAGARARDELVVLLEGVRLEGEQLTIARPPVQIAGRWQALVSLVGAPDPQGLQRVRHYNPASGRLDGEPETIRIPALPPDRYGRRLLEPGALARSELNRSGWLIQGAPASDGLFTVQAIVPYALLELTPQRQLEGTEAALAFLRRGSWSPQALRPGRVHTTALIPDGGAANRWEPGERALLMHVFGGIGGPGGEPVSLGTVTGHFSFGEAQVVRDAFTGRPRFQLRYHQIYANNPNGIVSGSQDWSAYAGSLQRGWIGLRPFSDVLIPLGGEVLDAIALQSETVAARYRSGDGDGVALVTAATSCVQDSSQALWIAIQQLRQRGDLGRLATSERERLERLVTALDRLLRPFGRVRGDWSANASIALASGTGLFQARQSWPDALLSWRSLLPRGAHDAYAAEVLRAGLPLQVLRTNQIPGADPQFAPVAPTTLLGRLPVVRLLVTRVADSLFSPLFPAGGAWGAGILLCTIPLALVLRRGSSGRVGRARWPALVRRVPRALLLLAPALAEELLFRGLLLPSPWEGVAPLAMLPWVALSVGLFVGFQVLVARWGRAALRPRRRGRWLLGSRLSLSQSGLLGLACSLVYLLSGSFWQAVLVHWLGVMGGAQEEFIGESPADLDKSIA